MSGIIILLQDEAPSNDFEGIYWNFSRSDVSIELEFIVQLPSAVQSSMKISVPVPVAAIHAHAITSQPPCLTKDLGHFLLVSTLLASL